MHEPTQRVFFLIPKEVHLLDIFGPAHIFYEAACYGAPVELHYISLTEKEVLSSAGIQLGDLKSFEKFVLGPSDLIFIPGLEFKLLDDSGYIQRNQPFFDWLNEQEKQGAKICSVCTGAYLLAYAGLLDFKTCTTHWKYLDDFNTRFPKTDLVRDRLFVESDGIYTSAGVSSGIDLSLFILEKLYGSIFAAKIAKEVVIYLRRTEEDPQLSVFLQFRNHLEQRVHSAQDFLSQHIDQKITIDHIAEAVNMSPRNLTRLFKKTTGITIGNYVDKLRIERAVQLLSEGNKVDAVSKLCGLQSSNQLRSLLKKYKSALPNQLQSL